MRTYLRRFLSSGFKLPPPARGFTIIELLVVVVIIVLITGTLLIRQQGFNSSTLLRSLAYSVALSIRQAQVYGVSVREQTTQAGAGTGAFSQGYGVQFSSDGCKQGNQNRYQLYADINNDGLLTSNLLPVAEELPCYTVGNGRGTDYKVLKFCAHPSTGGSDVCYPSSPTTISSLSIYFRRPNPDACFATNTSPNACAAGGAPVGATTYTYGYIQLQAQGGTDTRTIKVTNTGQITVCKLNADPATC
jgi:prepilin-type N-terminal cleavage/methylation domain-containing protein